MTRKRALIVAILAIGAICAIPAAPYAQTLLYLYRDRQQFPVEPQQRAQSAVVNLPLTNPAADKWRFVNAFPGVGFDAPTVALFRDDQTVFVLERAGRIWSLRTEQGVQTKDLLLDFRDKVGLVEGEEGAVGMVLHPEFGQGTANGRTMFVYYTSNNGQLVDRLERLTFDPTYRSIEPQSVETLIAQRDDHMDHNGGDLHFGPDGFLYVSVGDEGQLGHKHSQHIDEDLFGGILRIDVDRRGGDVSHPPPRQPKTGVTSGYFIPNDNPFVGVPNALEEFWSIGLRNPYRFSIDPETHRMIGGDVGRLRVESVFEASKGSNHRWAYYEGDLEHRNEGQEPRPAKVWGRETLPVFTYRHGNLNSAIIGGFVYRGAALPALRGHYIYGDNNSGRVWALDLQSKVSSYLTSVEDRGPYGLSGFAQDLKGELYAITMGIGAGQGRIQRLESNEGPARDQTAIPKQLSGVRFFSDLSTLDAPVGAASYSLNQPMWHGFGGLSQRNWVLRMSQRSTIRFSGFGEWETTGGMLFVKHLELAGRRIETQFLVMSGAGEGYGLSYEWNPDGKDAEVVLESKDVELAGGRWRFSASSECSACHNTASGFVLGVSSRQLNKDGQLVALRKQGLFEARELVTFRMWGPRQPINFVKELLAIHEDLQTEPLVQRGRLGAYPRLAGPTTNAASLDDRVRSYLDVNCGHCHRPHGSGGGGFDARFATPLMDKGIIRKAAQRPIDEATLLIAPGEPSRSLILKRISSNQPGVAMPPLGVHAPDPAAVTLFREWIRRLK